MISSNVTELASKCFIFIGGAEGSGTTFLRRLLAAPTQCASLGPDLVKLPDDAEARPLFEALIDASKRLWDRSASLAEHMAARRDWQEAANRVRLSPAYADRTHIVMKRSFPFSDPRGRFVPDLWDVLDLPGDNRIVIIYRDPCAASYSAFRRGFDTDLRRLAVLCGEQLTWLAGQVRAIGPERIQVVSYRSLCQTPETELRPLAAFCGIAFEPVSRAAREEGPATGTDRRYAAELPPAETAWLEGFFSDRRRRQWANLADTGAR